MRQARKVLKQPQKKKKVEPVAVSVAEPKRNQGLGHKHPFFHKNRNRWREVSTKNLQH